jgi:hypothetical protein
MISVGKRLITGYFRMLVQRTEEIEVLTSPYPHIALAGSLAAHDDLVRDFPTDDRFGRQIRMHGDLTEGDAEYERLLTESAAFKGLHDWTYSTGFIQAFLDIFDEEIDLRVKSGDLLFDPRTLPIKPDPFEGRTMINVARVSKSSTPFLFPRLDIGIGKLNYGKVNGGGGIHVDNLTRLVSVLVYIDHNPTLVGGEHRLYRLENGATPVIDKIYAPEPNLMVASLQSNLALHDVNPVTEIEGVRKAIYMAVSCSTEIWKPHSDRRLQRLTKNRYRPTMPEKIIRKAKKVLSLA